MWDKLREAKYKSCLDLKHGFWLAALDEESRPYTAFSTPFGHFEYNCVPMGLCQSSAYFQNFVETKLRRNGILYEYVPVEPGDSSNEKGDSAQSQMDSQNADDAAEGDPAVNPNTPLDPGDSARGDIEDQRTTFLPKWLFYYSSVRGRVPRSSGSEFRGEHAPLLDTADSRATGKYPEIDSNGK